MCSHQAAYTSLWQVFGDDASHATSLPPTSISEYLRDDLFRYAACHLFTHLVAVSWQEGTEVGGFSDRLALGRDDRREAEAVFVVAAGSPSFPLWKRHTCPPQRRRSAERRLVQCSNPCRVIHVPSSIS